MSNETLQRLIRAYDTGKFPSFVALRPLSDTVVFGYLWLKRPRGESLSETSRPVYFVLEGTKAVGIVYDMGKENLHWYVLKEHRKKGHLSRALHGCILPHLFAKDREQQFVTVETEENAKYVARLGFVPVDQRKFVMQADSTKGVPAPEGKNRSLSEKEREELRTRIVEARAIIQSVREKFECHWDDDPLFLRELAEDMGQLSLKFLRLGPDDYLP